MKSIYRTTEFHLLTSFRFPSSSSPSSPVSGQEEEELKIIVADMFGFDTSNNGLEQFCTNWTAELMQQSYYECVFKVWIRSFL